MDTTMTPMASPPEDELIKAGRIWRFCNPYH